MAGQSVDAMTEQGGTTKSDILWATERLVARQGVAATSISQINAAADQRNRSAVYYHFGSLFGVFDEIIARRLQPIDRHRMTMLAAAQARAGGGPVPLPDIARALVAPHAERLFATPGPHYFSRFVMQINMEADARRRLKPARKHPSLAAVRQAFARACPHLPPAIARRRYVYAIDLMMTEVARMEDLQERNLAGFDAGAARMQVGELIAAVQAILAMPLSPPVPPGADEPFAGKGSGQV